MVSFELGKEIERDVLRLVTCGTKKKFEVPMGRFEVLGLIYHGDSELFLCPALVTR